MDRPPRNSLGGDQADVATPTTSGGASVDGVTGAPLAAPVAETASLSANLADNALTPRAPEAKKTRFAARAAEVKEKKTVAANAKQQEKVLATAAPASADETASKAAQAAAFGRDRQGPGEEGEEGKACEGNAEGAAERQGRRRSRSRSR